MIGENGVGRQPSDPITRGDSTLNPTFFASPDDLRAWLEAHHDSASELSIGFYKKGSGKGGITYTEALDQALCFGWIDGVRRRIDDDVFQIRFTPRKPKSIWSAVNIARAEELTRLGLMHPAGMKTFEGRDPTRANLYSFENRDRGLDEEYVRIFQENAPAWSFFSAQPPGYRQTAAWWVISAKKEETRRKRLATLIDDSANGRRLAAVTYTRKTE